MSIKKKILVPMIVVAVIVASTILLSAIFLFSKYVDQNIDSDLDRAMHLIMNEIELIKIQSKFAALYTANDNVIINALETKNYDKLKKRTVEIYEESELTVLAITDECGIVRARGHYPDVYGDDISARVVTRTALEGRHEIFVERGPIIPVVIASGIPVYNALDTLIGTITVGFRMDTNDFVDKLKNLTGCEISVFADGKCVATTLLEEDGNRILGKKIPENIVNRVMSGETVIGQFHLPGQRLQVKYVPLNASSGEIIGMLCAGRYLAARAGMIWSFITVGLFILLVLIVVSIPTILLITGRIAAPINKSLDQLHYDALTGIYNRRYFNENIEKVIQSLARSRSTLSLMMVDIDSFKKYNDTYGHCKGDECLKLVATALSDNVKRAEDFVARYGGEEFVVVLMNTDEPGVRAIADRLLKSVYNLKITHENSDAVNYVTVSIGVTSGNAEYTQTSEDYVSCADEMLYKSKSAGRNRYTFSPLKVQTD